MLAGQGFAEVYNLKGGFKAWNGQTAVGPAEMGMTHLAADAGPADILQLAYAMEAGLGDFYRSLTAGLDDDAAVTLISRLAKMEEGHKQKVFRLYRRLVPDAPDAAVLEARLGSGILEGGFTTGEFLQRNREAMRTPAGVFTVAMMLEAQALDLYMRFAQRAAEHEGRNVLQDLAEEEKSHLRDLGGLMDRAA
jgi:rubrerythrin